MRAHGVPKFPDPDSQRNFGPLDQQQLGISKQATEAAQNTCKPLLRSGGTGTPQQRAQKLAYGVKVSECLRAHGYPTFPDPTAAGERIPPDVNTNSPQFQSAEASCERQAQKALGLP